MDFDSYTDFLFARPSFISGAARILDIGSTFNFYNYRHSPEEADRLAIKSDFFTIGNDIRSAMSQFK